MTEQGPWEIRLENLRVGWPDLVVLDNVNSTIPAGKITVILGGSGCGKSTLLSNVLGLNHPQKGKVYVGGKDFFKLKRSQFRAIRRRMGVLFQDGALLGSLTLAQNTALPLKEHSKMKTAEISDVVHEKLSLVGLEAFKEYYPSQLSGGMRKRAGLARAIVADPPILFADEPTSGLDPINSAQMDELLLDMNKRLNVTVVVVSHDLQSMFKIADHVIVLNEGKAVFDDDVETLKNTDDPYLRRFLDRKAPPDRSVVE